ncbi:MAG TPA: hypothetical protein VMA71_01225 [Alloacidobacterium sp.]|nr:hypothetical protein [Alloacidobacterium sp.]
MAAFACLCCHRSRFGTTKIAEPKNGKTVRKPLYYKKSEDFMLPGENTEAKQTARVVALYSFWIMAAALAVVLVCFHQSLRIIKPLAWSAFCSLMIAVYLDTEPRES